MQVAGRLWARRRSFPAGGRVAFASCALHRGLFCRPREDVRGLGIPARQATPGWPECRGVDQAPKDFLAGVQMVRLARAEVTSST
jgi:hypothetical protein